jgi:hypothetical protein
MYKNKYLKYKNKYLCLKNSMKGGAASAAVRAIPAVKFTSVKDAIEEKPFMKPKYVVTYEKKYTLYCPRGKDHNISVHICESNNKEIVCESCEAIVINNNGQGEHYWRCDNCKLNLCTICFLDIKKYFFNESYLEGDLELQGKKDTEFIKNFKRANHLILDLDDSSDNYDEFDA